MVHGFINKHKEIQEYSSSVLDFVSYFKFINDYTDYTVEEFKTILSKRMENTYFDFKFRQIANLIRDKEDLTSLINNTQLEVELDIYTPDHKYSPKHTYSCEVEEADKDTFCVEVYSCKGLVKSYDISAIGITFEGMYHIVDKEQSMPIGGMSMKNESNVIESSIVNGVFDADNIVIREQFEKSYKAQYPKATDEAVNRIYGYLTQESEFSSNLHPLVESNMIKGKPGVPNFKNISELDDAINNTYLSIPYNDPMEYTKIIYNHLIKDKDRFRQVFNKYARSIPRPIDISILYPKQTTK